MFFLVPSSAATLDRGCAGQANKAARKAKMSKAADRSGFKHVDRLIGRIDIDGNLLTVGTLAWSRGDRRAYFQFDPAFIESGLPISPFKLKPSTGPIAAPYDPFDGLHGLFNDSIPDGWGRRVLDRSLQARRIDPLSLTPLDRLTFVGARGMGALIYVPDRSLDRKSTRLNSSHYCASRIPSSA